MKMNTLQDGRSLASRVRQNVQSGRMVNAIVIETYFDKVTVQLGGNGQILRNLPIVGGPVAVGQSVSVDFSSTPFQVVAKGNAYLTADDLETALKRVGVTGIGSDISLSILLFSGGSSIGIFSPTPDGLNSAILGAKEGDVVWLPDIDIELNVTVPERVTLSGISSRESIIRGIVTLSNESALENLAVVHAMKSTEEINCVVAPSEGRAWIKGCEIHAYNCSSGIAKAIKIPAGTELLSVFNSVIVADSKTNVNSWAFSGEGGTCRVTDCLVYSKSTTDYDGTTFFEYSRVGTVSEIQRMCLSVESELYRMLDQFQTSDEFLSIPHLVPASPEALLVQDSTVSNTMDAAAQYENFVYFEVTEGTGARTIREYNLDNGNTINVAAWPYSESSSTIFRRLTAVTRRELYTLHKNTGEYKWKVNKVNFEFETSTTVYEVDIEQDEGDPETGIGNTVIHDLSIHSLKKSDGDLYVILAGTWRRYEGEGNNNQYMYTQGPIFFVKNYTQAGAWTKIEGPAFFETSTVEVLNLQTQMFVNSQGRYLVGTADFQRGSGDPGIIGSWDIDLDTLETSFDYHLQSPPYLSSSAAPIDIASCVEDGRVYIRYNTDYDVSGVAGAAIYYHDPANGESGLHKRITTFNSIRMWRNNLTVILAVFTGSTLTTSNLSTDTVLLNNVTPPIVAGMTYQDFLNDANELVIYKTTDGVVTLWGVDDNTTYTFNTGLSATTTGATCKIFPMKDHYMLFSTKYVGPGSTFATKRWLIRETP